MHQRLLLLLIFLGVCQTTICSTPDENVILNTGVSETKFDTSDEQADGSYELTGNRISTPKESLALPTINVTHILPMKQEQVNEEVLRDLIEASKHSPSLTEDQRFNKLVSLKKLVKGIETTTNLPPTLKMNKTTEKHEDDEYDNYNYDEEYSKLNGSVSHEKVHSTTATLVNNSKTAKKTNTTDEEYDYYNYNYDDDYNYDDNTNQEDAKKSTNAIDRTQSEHVKKGNDMTTSKQIEMKPIKESSKDRNLSTGEKYKENGNDDVDNNSDDGDTDDYHGEDYDADDNETKASPSDINDEEEVMYSENIPCPRYCVCSHNINSYMVATCSRLDQGTQKFGLDITDLIVIDVGPKYPIVLGSKFFSDLGLKHVSTIKLANCTVEYVHPNAFEGLEELYSVNLTNIGLTTINPNTFSDNKKLRMLTITGNDLSLMLNGHYLLKSPSMEELDLSRNNLGELNPTAFSQLPSVVYINLSQNNLQRIPATVFDPVYATLEELDLSYNALKTLPSSIFNKTKSLAILHLKYNSISGLDLRFGSSALQQLDLSFNSINHIHHGMFDKMIGLTNLNLKGNGITKLQPDSLLTLKSLRHIDLSINELDQISSMVFYKNSELDVIRLNDNPRLSQLPTDGFLNYNGLFTVYYLDVSNCAIGGLGHNTFSTMPHLVTLKLAWNNINNLERDSFHSLTKLIDLDLSNNLITRFDELTFMNNNDLTKLNLSGNPIQKMSIRLFLPMNKLRELDVSDCELTMLLSEQQFGVGKKYNIFDTLRTFNASANNIKKISSVDVKPFKNLRTLDISRNPLKCNEDFQDFISYVSLNTNMVPNKMLPSLENINSETTFVEFQAHADWAELAHEVCKHLEGNDSAKIGNKLENRIKEVDNKLDEDTKNLFNIVENNIKAKKYHNTFLDRRTTSRVSSEISEDDLEDYDKDDEYTDEDDDDNATDYKEANGKLNIYEKIKHRIDELKTLQKDFHTLAANNAIKSNDPQNLIEDNKELYDDNSVEEAEVIVEHGRIYYSGYRQLMVPLIVLLTCTIIILLCIAKVVATVLRKRDERYRMALLASSNNSIVYQKLTEDINPKALKDPKPPKVHRYALLNQV